MESKVVLAIVCGMIPCGNKRIPQLLGVVNVTFTDTDNTERAKVALQGIAYINNMSDQDFADFDGATIYFYTVRPGGMLDDSGFVCLSAEEVQSALNQDADSESPATLEDLEPFDPPDSWSDSYDSSPDYWWVMPDYGP